MPIMMPAERLRVSGSVAYPMSAIPPAYKSPPRTITRPAPHFSATALANGWPAPHSRFCTAMAKANTSRPVPSSTLIGVRNRPKLARSPNTRRITIAPAASTTIGVRQTGLG
jgi:hypothetical protein